MHIRPWPLEILAYRALSDALFFLSCPLTNDYNTIGQHLSERKLFEKNKIKSRSTKEIEKKK